MEDDRQYDWQWDFFNNYIRIMAWIAISCMNALVALCVIVLLSLAIRAGYRSCRAKREARQKNKARTWEDCVLDFVSGELSEIYTQL